MKKPLLKRLHYIFYGKKKRRKGFTLLEIIIAMAIISILSMFTYGKLGGTLLKAREARARMELSQITKATHMYFLDHGEYPEDVSRGMPPGIEEYLGPGSWPDTPWEGSEYDWDSFMGSDGKQVYQISIRFCPLGKPAECKFPDAHWAEDFDYYSSFYMCIQGICKAHPAKPDDHPGYCVNCGL